MKIHHTLSVERRDKTGSRYAKRDRDAGRLPAVLYGHGRPPVSLSLDAKEAVRFFESGEKLFEIELASEGAKQAVFLKDLQFDYLGTNIVHVDLTRVDLSEEVDSNVPLEFVGEAAGAKSGGIVQTQMDALPVRCAVQDLPEVIRVDIANVTQEQPLHTGDIELPANVVLNTDKDDIVVSISFATAAGIEGEAEQMGAEDGSPEVINEKKPE